MVFADLKIVKLAMTLFLITIVVFIFLVFLEKVMASIFETAFISDGAISESTDLK
ncbi:MAG: hypothetical protein IPH74_12205 [Bacteroidetes bacterium]|nr:hypothetical protein [Bacteroidota bacterium]